MRESTTHEVIWSKTRCTQYYFDGRPLTKEDNDRLATAITIMTLILIDVLERYNIPYKWRDITRFFRHFPKDTLQIKSQLDDCIESIIRKGAKAPGYMWIVKPIHKLIADMDNSWRGICIRRDLNTLFSHIGHLTLLDIDSGCLEESTATLTAPYTGSGNLCRLSAILAEYQFDANDFAPQYSGGATVECVRGSGPAIRWGVPGFARTRYVFAHIDPAYIQDFTYTSERPISELIEVPKSLTKKRPITIEPTQQCFIQHGLRRILEAGIKQHQDGITIKLEDQSINQRLALDGSFSQYWATIDLSSASDSVKRQHVMCFPQPIADLLLMARTPWFTTDPDHSNFHYMETYAGMGNPTTFRVECIIFAAIARMACEDAGITVQGSVYGDDIIVPSTAVPDLLRLLAEFGFKVNQDKSYWDGNFRESCGIEAYMGNDITPVRLPRNFMYGSTTAISCLRDYANHLLEVSPRARRFILAKFLGKRKLYASYTDESYLLSTGTNLNTNIEWRYNKQLQRYEYKVTQETAKYEEPELDSCYKYQLMLLSRTHRTSLMHPDDLLDTRFGRVSDQRECLQWHSPQ